MPLCQGHFILPLADEKRILRIDWGGQGKTR